MGGAAPGGLSHVPTPLRFPVPRGPAADPRRPPGRPEHHAPPQRRQSPGLGHAGDRPGAGHHRLFEPPGRPRKDLRRRGHPGGPNDRRGKIWGDLVPYGMSDLGFNGCASCPWRAGANENTTFTVTHDVQVQGQKLPAGTYGLHMIPGKDEWTIIFSKDANAWGSYWYDAKNDALRVKTKPAKSEYHEWLTYEFTERDPAKATVALEVGGAPGPGDDRGPERQRALGREHPQGAARIGRLLVAELAGGRPVLRRQQHQPRRRPRLGRSARCRTRPGRAARRTSSR